MFLQALTGWAQPGLCLRHPASAPGPPQPGADRTFWGSPYPRPWVTCFLLLSAARKLLTPTENWTQRVSQEKKVRKANKPQHTLTMGCFLHPAKSHAVTALRGGSGSTSHRHLRNRAHSRAAHGCTLDTAENFVLLTHVHGSNYAIQLLSVNSASVCFRGVSDNTAFQASPKQRHFKEQTCPYEAPVNPLGHFLHLDETV